MLGPGARDAVGREDALRLLTELRDVQCEHQLKGMPGTWKLDAVAG